MSIYVMFIGGSAFIVCRVQKKGKGMYQNNRLFLYRQLASKVRTMRFTMGTLTILLVCALLGSAISLMFAKYQSQAIDNTVPFDVLIYSPLSEDDFSEEISTIQSYNGIKNQRIYQIYKDGSQVMNRYLAMHVTTILEKHIDKKGNFISGSEYYKYDTYMKVSDYNALREMLGEEAVSLGENEYAIQTKARILGDLGDDIVHQKIESGNRILSLSEIYTEAFSQNGINGADYLIIAPDDVCEKMDIYYSVYAADLEGEGKEDLKNSLEEVHRHKHGVLTYDEYEVGLEEEEEEWQGDLLEATGTDQIIVSVADLFVRDIDTSDFKFVVTSVTFPLAYIALIFTCVALTILAVQQLSDSGKYKFRYDVLKKLGMKKREIDKVIFHQLALYYLVPAAAAVAISSVIAIYAGNQFVRYTGAEGNGMYYFGVSLLITAGIYMIYFVATYIGFRKNVNE